MLENAEIRRRTVCSMPTAPSTLQTTAVCYAMGNRKNNATVTAVARTLAAGFKSLAGKEISSNTSNSAGEAPCNIL